MNMALPLYRTLHVLYVDDDWVIRQLLLEYFAGAHGCQVVSFSRADLALSWLRQQRGAERIFSNIGVSGGGGIDLSHGSAWRQRIVLALAPGYDAERERFRDMKAGRGFFRVKPYPGVALRRMLQHTFSPSSCP